MASLSGYLLDRCYRAITDSRLVDPQDDLGIIFAVDELNLCQNRIPYADNAKERAEKIIKLLLSEKEGLSLLLAFLRVATTRFPKEDGWRRELSECCALVEIEHVLRSTGNEKKYVIEDVAELVKRFYDYSYIKDTTYEDVLSKLPPEIIGKERKRRQDLQERNLPQGCDVPAIVSILITCLSIPDGVGRLAWALYQLDPDNETEEWQELDSLVRKLCKVDVTYARLQQLQFLLERMKLPLNVLLNTYRASVPAAAYIPNGDEKTLLPTMLAELGMLPQDVGNILPVTEFAFRLAQNAEQSIQKAVESWIEARVQALEKNVPQYMDVLKSRLKDPAPAPARYLLIVVEPQDEQTFEVRAWLLDNQNQPAEKTESYISSEPMLSENIPGCIDEIRKQYAAYLSPDLTIEVFLSDKDLLCCAIDHWLVDGGRAKRKFGIMHKLVVRSLERVQDILVLSVWRQKWNVFQQFVHDGKFEGGNNDPDMRGPFWKYERQDHRSGDALYGVLNISPVVCLTMGFIPSSSEAADIHAATVDAGVPIVLWPRKPMQDLANAFDRFREHLGEFVESPQKLLNLPDWVLAQRVEAINVGDNHHGHHLTLLWDDPNRLPPDIAGQQFVYQR